MKWCGLITANVCCTAIPLDDVRQSENVMVVLTARGGHNAFLDGLLSFSGPNYMERVFAQFFTALFQHSKDLDGPTEFTK